MRHKDEKKYDAICNASIYLINEIGFAQTSMSKIAKKAKMSSATIYVYFENKEDMLNKVYLMVKHKMSIKLFKGLKTSLSVEQSFRKLWYNAYDYVLNYSDYFTFCEQFENSPLIKQVNKQEAYKYYQPIFDVFERGKMEKIFKNIPNEILVAFSFYPIVRLAKKHLSGEFIFDKKILELTFAIGWQAIAL